MSNTGLPPVVHSINEVAVRFNVQESDVLFWRDQEGCKALQTRRSYNIRAIELWLNRWCELQCDPEKFEHEKRRIELEERKLLAETQAAEQDLTFLRDKKFVLGALTVAVSAASAAVASSLTYFKMKREADKSTEDSSRPEELTRDLRLMAPAVISRLPASAVQDIERITAKKQIFYAVLFERYQELGGAARIDFVGSRPGWPGRKSLVWAISDYLEVCALDLQRPLWNASNLLVNVSDLMLAIACPNYAFVTSAPITARRVAERIMQSEGWEIAPASIANWTTAIEAIDPRLDDAANRFHDVLLAFWEPTGIPVDGFEDVRRWATDRYGEEFED